MIKDNELVSILIVSYNAEKFILQTVKSCLNQSYRNIEILILDNASSDKTVEILRTFSDERVKIFKKEKNVGPYVGLNFLLGYAKGKYVAIQDHDDIWFPEKIEKQIEFLEKNQQILACGTEAFYYYEKRGLLLLDKCQGLVDFVNHTSLVFRNNEFRYNTDYVLADEYFEKKVLKNKGNIFCISEPLVIHRIRNDGNNLSHSRFLFTRKNLKDFFEINGFNKKSLVYIAGLFLVKYFPEKIVWLVINIVKIKSKKISKNEFVATYPEINL